jgi:hypothetical protein
MSVCILETEERRRERETHAIALVVQFLAPAAPLARAAQIRAAHATLLEELPRWFPVVALRLARASALLLL